MKKTLIIPFQIILILSIIGCQNIDKKEKESVQKEREVVQTEFGILKPERDSLSVELDINNFNNWFDLVNRVEKIACNDSLPKLTLASDKALNTIYFLNTCLEDESMHLIKTKNIIEIHNNKINQNVFPLDSLESVLRRDIENNGKNPEWSESPEKLIVFISFDTKNEFDKLPHTLKQLTETYNRITNKTDIKIWLDNKEHFNPPPPAAAITE